MSKNYRKYLDPKTLARLNGLELRARVAVEGYLSGVHRSPHQGFSIEFAEHREYTPGDDIRYVDWKVFGRTDKYHLKRFEEETNLICNVLLDVSKSMGYRGADAPMSKLDYAKCVGAALAYMVLQQQDSVGLVTFDKGIRSIVEPSGNPSHLEQLLTVMEESFAEQKTACGSVFHDLAERFKKRGIVVIISDFFDDIGSMLAGLKHLRHRRNEVILVHVLDQDELSFPFEQLTMFRGLEQSAEVLFEPRALREAYIGKFGEFIRQLREGCRMHRIDYVQMPTDRSLDVALSSYLASRSARAVKSGK